MNAPGAGSESAQLSALLAHLAALPADGDAAHDASVDWLAELARWLRGGDGPRLPVLTSHLGADPAACARFGDTIRRLLARTDALRMLTEAGFPSRNSLAEEVLVRLVRSIVPHAADPGDLWDLTRRVMAGTREALWLRPHSDDDVAELFEVTGLTERGGFRHLYVQLAESVEFHCVNAAAIGLAGDMRRAAGRGPIAESPFRRLAAAGARFVAAVTAEPPDPAAAAAARRAVEEALAGARRERDAVHGHIETAGVSSDMVLRLDILGLALDRVEAALPALAPRDDERRPASVARVVTAVAAGVRQQGSFRRALADRSRLLAKSVVERCGATGSHYITSGRRDWWDMARAGAGGGIVIGFVVWAKVLIHDLHPPPAALAFLAFLDYATGFLLIYSMHFALATKQPPMTAAALADALAKGREGRDMSPVVTLVQRICRSQVAGLVGNVVFTALTALTLDVVVHLVTGHGIVRADEAAETLAGHHPFRSLCLLFAVGTGTAVWISSMVSGWAENAAHYGRLNDSLAHARGGRVTAWIVRNIGGVAGNVSLALLLVLITFGGGVSGIPWDVRHVTVSTGQVTLALIATSGLTGAAIAWPVAGVLLVGVLNIVTGFGLSLFVATRARGIRARVRITLLPALAASLVRRPWRFFVPVDDDDAPTAAH